MQNKDRKTQAQRYNKHYKRMQRPKLPGKPKQKNYMNEFEFSCVEQGRTRGNLGDGSLILG